MWVPRPIWPMLPTFSSIRCASVGGLGAFSPPPNSTGHSRSSGIHTVTNIRIQVFIVFCIWEESYLGQRDRTGPVQNNQFSWHPAAEKPPHSHLLPSRQVHRLRQERY